MKKKKIALANDWANVYSEVIIPTKLGKNGYEIDYDKLSQDSTKPWKSYWKERAMAHECR